MVRDGLAVMSGRVAPGEEDRALRPAAAPVDPFWLRNGIKGGLAAVLALLYVNWAQPPGGAIIPLGTWLMVVMSRTYVHTLGDLRALQYAFWTALAGLPFGFVMLWTIPAMASYGVLNAMLFICLFLFGSAAVRHNGMTFVMSVGILAAASWMGLNQQATVGFQQVSGAVFGVVLSVGFGALWQRLLWPILPQWELRRVMASYFRTCCLLVGVPTGPVSIMQRNRAAMLLGEAGQWASHLPAVRCPPGEPAVWVRFLDAMRVMGVELHALAMVRRADSWPEVGRALGPLAPEFERKLVGVLEAYAGLFEGAEVSPEALRLPIDGFLENFAARRAEGDFMALDLAGAARAFGYVSRCQRIAAALDRAAGELARMHLDDYAKDSVL